MRPINLTVYGKPLALTPETIAKTRQYYIDNCAACIVEAVSGAVRVNDLDKYIAWNKERAERFKTGENDNTFTFIQMAVYLQTGESVPLLS